jgi:multiple sugar transport system substrate-binding protein
MFRSLVQTFELGGVGWDHPRCRDPLLAASRTYAASRPGVDVRWDWRPLAAFEDQPLAQLAEAVDLIVIDHPHCGAAAVDGALAALDELLEPAELAALADAAAGPSHRSYQWDGHQWALALDAACQVAAARPDAIGDRALPASWPEVLELADAGVPVAVPLAPAHAMCTFLALCVAEGAPVGAAAGGPQIDEVAALRALETLVTLHERGPTDARELDPPALLDRIANTDTVAYSPLLFGYVTAAGPVVFGRPPAGASVLGGAGIAVSARSTRQREAAAFAAWLVDPAVQRDVIGPAGGQPGARAAWEDPDLDAAASGFFSATLPTLDGAWTRQREPWWPAFQDRGGRALHAGLAAGRQPRALLDALLQAIPREVPA